MIQVSATARSCRTARGNGQPAFHLLDAPVSLRLLLRWDDQVTDTPLAAQQPGFQQLSSDLVGISTGETAISWDERDVMTYALGVGAGSDPAQELGLTTENSGGHTLAVLPTFGGSLVLPVRPDWNRGAAGPVVHAAQSLELSAPLPTSGVLLARAWVDEVLDKGRGAVVRTRTEARNADGTLALTVRNAAFVVGAGGFGGVRGADDDEPAPGRAPDGELSFTTRPDQALVFRLSGDHNPLHTDPERAEAAGYPRPILHGLATSGIAVRLLVNELCAGDPTGVKGFAVRYTAPLFPGDALSVRYWVEPASIRFQVSRADGTLVCDRGSLSMFSPSPLVGDLDLDE